MIKTFIWSLFVGFVSIAAAIYGGIYGVLVVDFFLGMAIFYMLKGGKGGGGSTGGGFA